MIPRKSTPATALELNSIQTGRFKTETLSVTVRLPLDKTKTPLYSLVLSVLKRGTKKYPSQGHINRRLDELYATGVSLRLDRYGNNCVFGFSAELLDEAYTDGTVDIFDGALDVIEQLLFHPLTDEEGCFLSSFVESEKDIACDLIQSVINNPKSYASMRCREIMFENDDYGSSMSGTIEQIRGVSAKSLTAFYRELIANKAFHVFYIGSKSEERVKEKLLRRFSPYLDHVTPFSPCTDGCRAALSAPKRVDEQSDVAQGKLVIGIRSGVTVLHKDFYAMMVFSEILGGSPVSKLFMNVRERLGLCYYCSASYEIYKGSLFISSGVSPDKREAAEQEIFRQIKDIQNGQVTSLEFEAAVKSLVNSYRALFDLPANMESYYMGRDLFGLSCSLEQCINEIRRVTLEDVVRVSGEIAVDTIYFLWGDAAEEGDADEDI